MLEVWQPRHGKVGYLPARSPTIKTAIHAVGSAEVRGLKLKEYYDFMLGANVCQ